MSGANLEALRSEGIEYVIAERLRRSTVNAALARAGRYKRVGRNLERAAEDARQRDAIVQQLQEKLAAGGVREQLKNGARRYLKLTGATPEIDLKKVQEDARLDGKWVLRTMTSLPPQQVAPAYRGLWRVEHAFRTLKVPLELRSLFHTSDAGVRGHVQACVLAYALMRLIEDRLDAASIDLNAKNALQDLARIQRAPLARAGVTVTKTSTPNEQHQRLLNAIGAPAPGEHAAA